jgi:hypothetical protein
VPPASVVGRALCTIGRFRTALSTRHPVLLTAPLPPKGQDFGD